MVQTFDLVDETDTAALGRALAGLLGPGDTLLLDGPIGSGKSHLARALIRARLGEATEVPSPTFTLVQTYPGRPEIWHADLYRLTHPDEVLELGLEDAFATAICLVEWPDRLGRALPEGYRLAFSPWGEGRRVTLSPDLPDLPRAFRDQQAEDFLARHDRADSPRQPLTGDASARRYTRLPDALLMDAPPGQPDRVEDFARISRHLTALDLSAPQILAEDIPRGFLLVEDLGDDLFPAVIARDPSLQLPLYEAATDVLRHLQAHPAPPGLPDLSAADWAEAAALALDTYAPASPQARADFTGLMTETLALADGPRVLILRDYHAENLLFLPQRPGLARIGLLDFQLGQMGQPGYDLVSLTQDARRDVPAELEAHLVARFDPSPDFAAAHAALGAQRSLRILGVFARLAAQGKPRYLAMIPRVRAQLNRNLAHPALARLRAFCATLP